MSDTDDINMDADDEDSIFTGQGTMDREELTEQLEMVQQMVHEMKVGFSAAMEQLSNIQFGDQNLQQQISNDRSQHQNDLEQINKSVSSLREDIEKLTKQMQEVVHNQNSLQEKITNFPVFNKEAFIEELKLAGLVQNQQQQQQQQKQQQPQPQRPENIKTKHVESVVQPYLASLSSPSKVDDSDAHSVTALACKSLNLSQALHEKCLHMDQSASSDEEETVRHSQSTSLTHLSRDGHLIDHNLHYLQKIPPHEKYFEEVQREKAVQEAVSSERTYCSQLWNLIDCYIRPLRQEEVMSQRDLNSIFPPYIPQLYEQHCLLLRRMEERTMNWRYSGMIGDVFLKLTDGQENEGMAIYKEFINDFPTIINNMNYWFSQSPSFRDIMRSSSLSTSSIVPLLLAPLQQVPKYSLIIKNILKSTGFDHPDRYYLDTALTRLKTFLSIMNADLEHAMQFVNLSKPMARSRPYGNSQRSRSSGSSCEANQISSARDSGIHSNGEDNLLRPYASPNATRRYVLQVLRDRREKDLIDNAQDMRDRPLSVPLRPSLHMYGSHPDLTSQELSEYIERKREIPTYMPYQTGTKMYSSLSKIQSRESPRSPEKPPRKIKIRRRTETPKLPINTNYLRPLTPHLHYNGSNTIDNYNDIDSKQRPRPMQRRSRSSRPSSSIDFTGGDPERRERIMEQLALARNEYETPQTFLDTRSSREDLHLSLQRLCSQRDQTETYDKEPLSSSRSYFEPLEVSSVHENDQAFKINSHEKKENLKNINQSQESDDYGIYGDEDDDEGMVLSQSPVEETSIHEVSQPNSSVYKPKYNNSDQTGDEILGMALVQSLGNNDKSTESLETKRRSSIVAQRALSQSTDSETVSDRNETSSSVSVQDRPSRKDFGAKSQTSEPTKPPRTTKSSSLERRAAMRRNSSEIESSSQNLNITSRLTSASGTLERAKKYAVQSEKSETEVNFDVPKSILMKYSEMNKSDKKDFQMEELKISSIDSSSSDAGNSEVAPRATPKSPSNQPYGDTPLAPSSHRTRRGSAADRIPKKLPIAQGRFSQPNLEEIHKSRIPSPTSPVSPLGGSHSALIKESKIPQFTQNKNKKDGKSPASPRETASTISKSTEDISKFKKKTPFKQSIKNFFGRKRRKTRYDFPDTSSLGDLTKSESGTDTDLSPRPDPGNGDVARELMRLDSPPSYSNGIADVYELDPPPTSVV